MSHERHNNMTTTIDYEKQAEDFLHITNSTLKATFHKNARHFGDSDDYRDIYNIVILTPWHHWRFKFGQSTGNSGYGPKRVKPTAYDVLAALTKYEVGTYSEFISDFGYEEFTESDHGDMIKNKETVKTYKAVSKEYENVSKAWPSEAHQELLFEIQ